MKQNILLLASSSASRQQLLREVHIPFKLVTQTADETKCDWNLPLQDVVQTIARYKMTHVLLPQGSEGEVCYVVTADTLSVDSRGIISGKPQDRADAIKKIKAARNGMYTGTAFCLDKKCIVMVHGKLIRALNGMCKRAITLLFPMRGLKYI